MPNNNGAQTIDADPKQTATVVDSEEPSSQSKERPGQHSITRRKRVLVISAAMLVAVAAGYFAWNAFRYEDTDDAQVDGHVMPLSARINGNIEQVLVMEGQLVHAGDVLVTIDPQDYKIAAVQAQANLADAQATSASLHWNVPITSVTVQSNLDSAKTAVVNAEAAVKASEQNYESAKAALVQAEANATKSDADLERAKQLVAKEDISRLQYDQAVATAVANRAVVVTGKRECRRTSRAASSGETSASQKRFADCGDCASADLPDSRQRDGSRRPGGATTSSTCASRDEPQLYSDFFSGDGNCRQE
jgi:membrane fusion protein, multidrug efflux system